MIAAEPEIGVEAQRVGGGPFLRKEEGYKL
jgi:hypothetical protein